MCLWCAHLIYVLLIHLDAVAMNSTVVWNTRDMTSSISNHNNTSFFSTFFCILSFHFFFIGCASFACWRDVDFSFQSFSAHIFLLYIFSCALHSAKATLNSVFIWSVRCFDYIKMANKWVYAAQHYLFTLLYENLSVRSVWCLR